MTRDVCGKWERNANKQSKNSVKSDTNGSESRWSFFVCVIKSHFSTLLFSRSFSCTWRCKDTMPSRQRFVISINRRREVNVVYSCSLSGVCARSRLSSTFCQVLFTHFAFCFVLHCDLPSSSFYTRTVGLFRIPFFFRN